MKKFTALFLIIMSLFLTSCGKGPGNSANNVKPTAAVSPQATPVPAKQPEGLKPPVSFLQNSNQNPPAGNIYYTGKAVVLTYHHISPKPFSSITVKPERFEADLKMLKDNYFNVISYRDMINAIQGNDKMPPNAVVISFDDGIESFYKYAFPLLKKYNMPAVNFVITSRTESYSPSADDFNPLSPDEIREMYKSGLVDIQSHSHNGHEYTIKNEKGEKGGVLAYRKYDPNTKTYEPMDVYDKRVVEDLGKSGDIIKKYTDNRPDTICFPYGHYNSHLIELSRKAGFSYFVTTVSGSNKQGSKNDLIYRIRSGDAKLTTPELMKNIINCGQGKKASS